MAETQAAADAVKFGKCCPELKDAISGDDFEPLITLGEDGVLYMSVGIVQVEDDDDEPAMVDHPLFFCPFCGSKVQTQEEVRAKAGDHGDDGETGH